MLTKKMGYLETSAMALEAPQTVAGSFGPKIKISYMHFFVGISKHGLHRRTSQHSCDTRHRGSFRATLGAVCLIHVRSVSSILHAQQLLHTSYTTITTILTIINHYIYSQSNNHSPHTATNLNPHGNTTPNYKFNLHITYQTPTCTSPTNTFHTQTLNNTQIFGTLNNTPYHQTFLQPYKHRHSTSTHPTTSSCNTINTFIYTFYHHQHSHIFGTHTQQSHYHKSTSDINTIGEGGCGWIDVYRIGSHYVKALRC